MDNVQKKLNTMTEKQLNRLFTKIVALRLSKEIKIALLTPALNFLLETNKA